MNTLRLGKYLISTAVVCYTGYRYEDVLDDKIPAAKALLPWLDRLPEWVMAGEKSRFIGRPWPGLLPNTWDAGAVREVRWELCRSAVGFRVVKEKVNVS